MHVATTASHVGSTPGRRDEMRGAGWVTLSIAVATGVSPRKGSSPESIS